MLMCYPHHKLIDVDELDEYPEQRLLDMKAAHEQRIAVLSDITPDRSSHVLRYAAKIGEHTLACTRFRRHGVRCFGGAGGASWRGGGLRVSSSLRRCA
jgi:hypothetical protein